MSTPHQERFVSLMEQFTGGQMDAAAFCAAFTALWVQDRDAAYVRTATRPGDADELLRGDDAPFRDIVNAVHSACAVFAPVPEAQWQLDAGAVALLCADDPCRRTDALNDSARRLTLPHPPQTPPAACHNGEA